MRKMDSLEDAPILPDTGGADIRRIRAEVEVEAPPEATKEGPFTVPVSADLVENVVKADTFPMAIAGTTADIDWAVHVVLAAKLEFQRKLLDLGYGQIEIEA